MFFTKNGLKTNARRQQHWQQLWEQRANSGLFVNADGTFQKDFWAELDNQVVEMRDSETGMEIVNDLMQVETTLDIGKLANVYQLSGAISEDVEISLDGQAPTSYDNTSYKTDGDPVPVFQAGYGVNWRAYAGHKTAGIDSVLDAQAAKLKVFYKRVVDYYLNGSDNISVEAYGAQGLRNHRNTFKVDLTDVGVDLTTAPATTLISFFTTGAFGQAALANFVDAYDVLWVSPQIMGNLRQAHVVNGSIAGTVLDAVLPFAPVKEIRQSFALSGNEFIGYQRRRDVVTPLVGRTVGVIALPRPMETSNFNFQILSAQGLQIKADAEKRTGVIYGANLT